MNNEALEIPAKINVNKREAILVFNKKKEHDFSNVLHDLFICHFVSGKLMETMSQVYTLLFGNY